MAKTLYLTMNAASAHRGTNSANLRGTAVFWSARALTEARTSSASPGTVTVLSVAGATPGVEFQTVPAEWISEPLSAGFTIAGTITGNLWAYEGNMSDNAAINFVVDRIDGATGVITQICKSANVVELPVGAALVAAANFTATPTSTACKRGDRLRVRPFLDDAGVMAAGGTNSGFQFDITTPGAAGDSWIQFTENLTFETTAPTGSTYYLTDTAETINPGGATEKKALTTRGSGSTNSVTNTAAGPTAGIQVTASAGGSAIEWYTPPLNAVTLGGMGKFNIRALESNVNANASLKAEIAVTATDGLSASVWGLANILATATVGEWGEITASDAAYSAWVAGDDVSVSAGQRLRFRIYLDDCGSLALATAFTVTVSYNGASASAAGDTYVTLPVTVTEQSAGGFVPKPRMLVRPGVTVLRAGVR